MWGINEEASGGTTFNHSTHLLKLQIRRRENNFQNRLVSHLSVLMKQHLYHYAVHISTSCIQSTDNISPVGLWQRTETIQPVASAGKSHSRSCCHTRPIHFHSNKINQPDASVSQIYRSSLKYSPTCFGHPLAYKLQYIWETDASGWLIYLNVWWCTDLLHGAQSFLRS